MKKYFTTLNEAKEKLAGEKFQRFSVMMRQGAMQLEYFSPLKQDTQQPHAQDELYIVVSGNATLERAEEKLDCKTGDVLFVPAGMVHRFIKFSNDFATWVIFYGKDGGETSDK